MGVNDAREQLEVAIEEFGKLERKLAAVEAERDAAFAVMEQARGFAEEYVTVLEHLEEPYPSVDGMFRVILANLEQSPASALAKVKADAIREAADVLDGQFWTSQGFYLRIEADRIEKEK